RRPGGYRGAEAVATKALGWNCRAAHPESAKGLLPAPPGRAASCRGRLILAPSVRAAATQRLGSLEPRHRPAGGRVWHQQILIALKVGFSALSVLIEASHHLKTGS
nr:hypothetical protein [Tanacetum cinerariifolium]